MDVCKDDLEFDLMSAEQKIKYHALISAGLCDELAKHIVIRAQLKPTPSAIALHMFEVDFVEFHSPQLGSFRLGVWQARHDSVRLVTWRYERQLWTGETSCRILCFEPLHEVLSPLVHYIRTNLAANTISLESYDLLSCATNVLSRWVPLTRRSEPRRDIEVFNRPLPVPPTTELPRGMWSGSSNISPPSGYLPRSLHLGWSLEYPQRIGPRTFRAIGRSAGIQVSMTVQHFVASIDSASQALRHLYVQDYGLMVPSGLYDHHREVEEASMAYSLGLFQVVGEST